MNYKDFNIVVIGCLDLENDLPQLLIPYLEQIHIFEANPSHIKNIEKQISGNHLHHYFVTNKLVGLHKFYYTLDVIPELRLLSVKLEDIQNDIVSHKELKFHQKYKILSNITYSMINCISIKQIMSHFSNNLPFLFFTSKDVSISDTFSEMDFDDKRLKYIMKKYDGDSIYVENMASQYKLSVNRIDSEYIIINNES